MMVQNCNVTLWLFIQLPKKKSSVTELRAPSLRLTTAPWLLTMHIYLCIMYIYKIKYFNVVYVQIILFV